MSCKLNLIGIESSSPSNRQSLTSLAISYKKLYSVRQLSEFHRVLNLAYFLADSLVSNHFYLDLCSPKFHGFKLNNDNKTGQKQIIVSCRYLPFHSIGQQACLTHVRNVKLMLPLNFPNVQRKSQFNKFSTASARFPFSLNSIFYHFFLFIHFSTSSLNTFIKLLRLLPLLLLLCSISCLL